jgi:hypothetical protein
MMVRKLNKRGRKKKKPDFVEKTQEELKKMCECLKDPNPKKDPDQFDFDGIDQKPKSYEIANFDIFTTDQ